MWMHQFLYLNSTMKMLTQIGKKKNKHCYAQLLVKHEVDLEITLSRVFTIGETAVTFSEEDMGIFLIWEKRYFFVAIA